MGKLKSSFLSNEPVKVKMIWQRDLGEEIECDGWSKIVVEYERSKGKTHTIQDTE